MLYKKNFQFGMTLLEILVTISIISILVTASIPVANNLLPGIRLNGSTRALSGDLREAQEKAITEQKPHLIRFDLVSIPPRYELIKIGDTGEEQIKEKFLPDNETVLLSPTVTDNQVIFYSDGGPSSAGDIELKIGTSSKTINVSPAGFIKIAN